MDVQKHWSQSISSIQREKQQQAFNKIKAYVAESIMLSDPNLNKPFEVYTDESDFAMGGLVTQNNQKMWSHVCPKS